jgi:hypothetical protein
VGKASGQQNLLGRWLNYADGGDGGNLKLRGRDPTNFLSSSVGDIEDVIDPAPSAQFSFPGVRQQL